MGGTRGGVTPASYSREILKTRIRDHSLAGTGRARVSMTAIGSRPLFLMLATVVLVAGLAVASLAPGAVSTSLVINEVDYDQPSTDTAEFLELKNARLRSALTRTRSNLSTARVAGRWSIRRSICRT